MWTAKNKNGKWHAFKEKPTLVNGIWTSSSITMEVEGNRAVSSTDSLLEHGKKMWQARDRDGDMFVYGSMPERNDTWCIWAAEDKGGFFHVINSRLNGWDSSLEEL